MRAFHFRTTVLALFAAACLAPPAAHALRQELWGNEPMPAAMFRDWPGVMPVINHRSRVYHVSDDGSGEWFYFRGNTAGLNAALRAFAKIGGEKRIVVIRPGPAQATSFDGRKAAYDWNLHLLRGRARAEFARRQIGNDWDMHPTITVHVGGGHVALDELAIPRGVTVLHGGQMIVQLREQLQAEDSYDRAAAATQLADLAPYSEQDARRIAGLLQTEKSWQMIRTVAGTLGRFGPRARFALPELRALLNHENEHVRARAAAVIEAIEQEAPAPAEEEAHRKSVERIEKFVRDLKAQAR